MKTISASALATSMCNLNNRHFGKEFGSTELTDLLKTHCGLKKAKEVLSELENHGVVAFLNTRKCQFTVAPTVDVIKNLL